MVAEVARPLKKRRRRLSREGDAREKLAADHAPEEPPEEPAVPAIPQSWIAEAQTLQKSDTVQETADNLQSIVGAGLDQYTRTGCSLGPEAPPLQMPEPDELEKLLQIAVGKDEFKLGKDKLSQLWAEEKKKDTHLAAEYASVGKKYTAQMAMRMEWVKKKLVLKTEKRYKLAVHKVKNVTFGEYLPIPVAVQKEGNDYAAIQAIQNYIQEAWKMTQEQNFLGDNPWFLVNPMTKRVELLYVKQQFKSSLENIWKHEKEFKEVGAKLEGTEDAQSEEQAAVPPPEPKQKKKDIWREHFTKAEKIKKHMQEVTTCSQDLLSVIASNANWKYWHNDAMLAALRLARQKLEEEKNQSAFWRDWVLQEKFAQYAKKHYNTATLKKELAKMQSIQDAIDAVKEETNEIRAMQLARKKK